MKKEFYPLIIILFFSVYSGFSQPFNDICENAIEFTDLDFECIFENYSNTSHDLVAGSCAPNIDGNVWFKFTAQGERLLIDAFNPANQSAYVTVWTFFPGPECDSASMQEITCGVTSVDYLGLLPNFTYYVSIEIPNYNGDYTVCIRNPEFDISPFNEQPCLSYGITPDSTCRSGTMDNADEDIEHFNCPVPAERTVWYHTSVDPGFDVLEIYFNDLSLTGPVSIQLLTFPNDNCEGIPVPVSEGYLCNIRDSTLILEDIDPGIYWIEVISSDSVTGDFLVCARQVQSFICATNTTCNTALDISASSMPDSLCFNTCNLNGGELIDTSSGDCFFINQPTVWFEFTTDFFTRTAQFFFNSDHLLDPQLVLYRSDNCDTFTRVRCATGQNGFLNFGANVNPSTHYYLAINDLMDREGFFDLCVDYYPDDSSCNVIDYIEPISTSYNNPLEGPYQSGEIVTFCYNIDLWRQLNCNFLQGIVPEFGEGWDPSSFSPTGEPIKITKSLIPVSGGEWKWYEEGQVLYNVNNPAKGFEPDDPMPAGWYFTRPGHSDPDSSLGDGFNCDEFNDSQWQVCFQLKALEYPQCEQNPGANTNITMHTFSDGEIGSWDLVACKNDEPQPFEAELFCCEGAPIDIPDQYVCDGDFLNISFSDTLIKELSWQVIDSGNIRGLPSQGNSLSISSRLFNISDQTDTLVLELAGRDVTGCYSESIRVNVIVYPNIFAEAGANRRVCVLDSTVVGGDPPAYGGAGPPYFYSWSFGSTEGNPVVLPPNDTTYYLSVVDTANCFAQDSIVILTDPRPTAQITAPSSQCEGGQITARIIVNGVAPYQYVFNAISTDTITDTVFAINDTTFQTVSIDNDVTLQLVDIRDDNCFTLTDEEITVIGIQNDTTLFNEVICVDDTLIVFDSILVTGSDTVIRVYKGAATTGCDSVVVYDIRESMIQVDTAFITEITDTAPGSIEIFVSGGMAPYSFLWIYNTMILEDSTSAIMVDSPGEYHVIISDVNGCSDSLILSLEVELGIEEILFNSLGIYPQPVATGGFLNITANQPLHGRIEWRDLNGRKIRGLSEYISHQAVQVPDLPGIYFLQIITGKTMYVQKIVVQ